MSISDPRPSESWLFLCRWGVGPCATSSRLQEVCGRGHPGVASGQRRGPPTKSQVVAAGVTASRLENRSAGLWPSPMIGPRWHGSWGGDRVRRLSFWSRGSARLFVWRASLVIDGAVNHRAGTQRRVIRRTHTATGTAPNGRVDASRSRWWGNAGRPEPRLPCRQGSRPGVRGAASRAR